VRGRINEKNKFLKSGVLAALVTLSAPVSALEKPQTMEDMWKIIQAQQKQIDEMKAGMQAAAPAPAKNGRCRRKNFRTKNRCLEPGS